MINKNLKILIGNRSDSRLLNTYFRDQLKIKRNYGKQERR